MNAKCKQIWAAAENNSQPVCLFISFFFSSFHFCHELRWLDCVADRTSHSQNALAILPHRSCFTIMVFIHFIYSFVAARSLDDECAIQWMKTGDGREQSEQCHLRFEIMPNERRASMIVECNVNPFVSSTKKYNKKITILFYPILSSGKTTRDKKKTWKVKINQTNMQIILSALVTGTARI